MQWIQPCYTSSATHVTRICLSYTFRQRRASRSPPFSSFLSYQVSTRSGREDEVQLSYGQGEVI